MTIYCIWNINQVNVDSLILREKKRKLGRFVNKSPYKHIYNEKIHGFTEDLRKLCGLFTNLQKVFHKLSTNYG